MTEAAPQERERSEESTRSPVWVRGEREGEIYRLTLDEEIVFAHRLPAWRSFRSINLRLAGPQDNQYTKLLRLRYKPLAGGAAPPRPPILPGLAGKSARDVRSSPGRLAGIWRDSVGAEFQIFDAGPTIQIQLNNVHAGGGFVANLTKRPTEADRRIFYEGIAEASFAGGAIPSRTVRVTVYVAGRDTLELRLSNWFEIGKDGKLNEVESHREMLTRAPKK